LLTRNMCHLINYRPYLLPSLSPNGGWIWCALSRKAKGRFTHIFITVDKFTKWIEVKPAAFITAVKTMEFIKEIMYKFGVSNNIITDNGTQFTAMELKEFCADLGIKVNNAPVSHPQSNG
jgi:hypothetical protein